MHDRHIHQQTESATVGRRRNLAVVIGGLLVGLGLLLSGTVLESTVLPRGTFVGTARRAPLLIGFQVLLIVSGAYFVIRRPSVTTVHLAAFALGSGLSGILGAVLLQLLYLPPQMLCGWRAFAPRHEQNELGFRGRSITYSPDDYVVVLLGDSQVEGMALAFDEMPERRLEANLHAAARRIRVFSIGAGAYGQDQELLALQEYFQKYRADLVILWQTPMNDIWNNVFNTHMASRNPKPTFWLDESGGLRGPTEVLGQPLADSPVVVGALWQLAFGIPWRDKRWERHLPEPYKPLRGYSGPVLTEWQERWNSNLGRMRDEELDTEKSHMAVMLTPRSKRMQYGLDLTRALTQRIQDLVASNHGEFVVFQVAAPEVAEEGDQVYVLNHKHYRASRRQYQDNWNYVNKGFNTEIVPITLKDWRVAAEDAHLNSVATAQVMTDLANRLHTRLAPMRLADDVRP